MHHYNWNPTQCTAIQMVHRHSSGVSRWMLMASKLQMRQVCFLPCCSNQTGLQETHICACMSMIVSHHQWSGVCRQAAGSANAERSANHLDKRRTADQTISATQVQGQKWPQLRGCHQPSEAVEGHPLPLPGPSVPPHDLLECSHEGIGLLWSRNPDARPSCPSCAGVR